MENPGGDKRIVLHPVKSAYAVRYPDFDAFAKRPLINNGYVGDEATTIDYYNTLFTYNNGMEE